MRLNLTQHNATQEQGCTEPQDKRMVQNLLTFDEIPDRKLVLARAIMLADIANEHNAAEAMIGGAPFLMPALERALFARGIQPLYAFSKREVVEEEGGKKTAIFRHVGFVPALYRAANLENKPNMSIFNRSRLADELLEGLPDDQDIRKDHIILATAIKSLVSKSDILDMPEADRWPDTYVWLRDNLEA